MRPPAYNIENITQQFWNQVPVSYVSEHDIVGLSGH